MIGTGPRSGGAQPWQAGATPPSYDAGTGEERFVRIADNMEGLITETRELVVSAREKYVDDPGVERTLNNLESLTAKLNRDIGPLMRDVRVASGAERM